MPTSQAVLKATSAGRLRQVRLLLEYGSSVEDADDCGQSPLIRAVFLDNAKTRHKILLLLLHHGAQVSKADVVGRNALMWSCVYGRYDDATILLENSDVDLDLNHPDVNGQTALFHAVTSGNAACVKLLVEALQKYSLSVDITDYSGVSPLMQAMGYGFDVCASILIKNGYAKVGLGMNYPKDLARVKKWARIFLRDREKTLNNTKFLPSLNHEHISEINGRQNVLCRKERKTRVSSASSDNNSSSESIKEKTSLYSVISQRKFEKFNNGIPADSLPVSVRKAINTTPSRIACVTDDDDDVDSCSSPCISDSDVFQPFRDLPMMYGWKQDQMSSSYRQTAKQKFLTRVNTLSGQSEKSNATSSSTRQPRKSKFVKYDIQRD